MDAPTFALETQGVHLMLENQHWHLYAVRDEAHRCNHLQWAIIIIIAVSFIIVPPTMCSLHT